MDKLLKISEFIDYLVSVMGVYGPVSACLIIMLESIFPVLPLSVFITFNFIYFGNIAGFILSWIFTVIGCALSFQLFRRGFRRRFINFIQKRAKAKNFMNKVGAIRFQHFVLLVAIPFTPAFLVNVAAGLSNMKFKDFLIGIAIGKIFLVYCLGVVGKGIVESLTNPVVLIQTIFILAAVYIISVIIKKKVL